MIVDPDESFGRAYPKVARPKTTEVSPDPSVAAGCCAEQPHLAPAANR